MQHEFICSIHNIKFGFSDLPDGESPALLRCPICTRKSLENLQASLLEMTRHRDLLLKAIDLKQLVQPGNSA